MQKQERKAKAAAYAEQALIGAAFFLFFCICCFIRYSYADDMKHLHNALASPGLGSFSASYTAGENVRLATNIITYLFIGNIWLWRICNAIVLTLFCVLISRISCLLAGEKRSGLLPQLAASLTFPVICTYVTIDIIWISSSFSYLWAATAGLLALYCPVKELAQQNKGTPAWLAYCLIPAGVYACLAQEQVAAVTFTLLLIILISLRMRKKKVPRFLVVQAAMTSLAFIVFLCLTFGLASNGPRMDEAAMILRERNSVPLDFYKRVFFFFHHIAHQYAHYAKYILAAIWALLLPRFLKSKQFVCASLCILFAAIALLSTFLPSLYDVGPKSASLDYFIGALQMNLRESFSPMQMIVCFYQLAAIIITPILLFIAHREEKDVGLSTLLLYLAGGASACVVAALPPPNYLYATRTFFVTCVLLAVIAVTLISSLKKQKRQWLAVCGLALLAMAQLWEALPKF